MEAKASLVSSPRSSRPVRGVPPARIRARISLGERTRAEILKLAVDIASAEGLEGLTIGRLADELQMSKSGLFAHFGSKEELQLAALRTAADVFRNKILVPAEPVARGLPRLVALLELWLAYVENTVFRGGCFFAAASLEFDGRPGAVRNEVVRLTSLWFDALQTEAKEACGLGHLKPAVDCRQLTFELHALVQEANWAHELLAEKNAFAWARRGIRRRLDLCATPAGRRLLHHLSRKHRWGTKSGA